MALLTSISPEDARALLAGYDLPSLDRLEPLTVGSVNSNFAIVAGARRLFLRVYEEQGRDGALAETAMVERLVRAGVPAVPALARTDGQLVSQVRGKPAALFPWLEGTSRCQAQVTAADASRVGEALARVHVAGAGETPGPSRFRYEDLLARLDRIGAAPDPRHAQLARVAPELRATLDRVHARRPAGLPQGLVHGDLFRDNVLWAADGRLAALLDFESAARGTFVFDLMVTLLAWCVGDDLDLGLARAMREGYERVRPLEEAERQGLAAEGAFACLRFAITRITDFSMRAPPGVPPARDWRRFMKRFDTLEALGPAGLRAALGA